MKTLSERALSRLAAELRWILLDVDGVLTDGGLYYDRRGEALKQFNVKDGLGLKLAQQAGLRVGLLTARSSPPLDRRAAELGLDEVLSGRHDKGVAFDEFLERHELTARQVAYIGDDLPDLVVLARAGLAFAPADAVGEVRAVAHRVLETAGGRGAAREMIEIVLRARGAWEQVLAPFSFDR